MKSVLVLTLIVCLQISILIHLQNMVLYILTKKIGHFRGFMATAFSNTMIGIGLAILVMLNRDLLQNINVDLILCLESGIIFLYMVYIKLMIVVRIVKRSKDPENFHLNYFGKKIYEKKVVDPKELMAFFCTLPFTLIIGAYFVAKIMSYPWK